MNKDLERMADHAVNISESGIFLIEKSAIPAFEDLFNMVENAKGMLADSIDAFVRQDASLAESIGERDQIVDALDDKILRETTALMCKDRKSIETSLHVMRIAHNLERIADLSTNICEDVIYMIEGKDIKHHHKDYH